MDETLKSFRVAMIGQYGVPAAYGGVERVVEELGAELVAVGVDVSVYCAHLKSIPTQRYRGMRLIPVRSLKGKHLGKFSLAGLATLDALRRDYDVIHFHAMGPCLFAPLVRIFRPSTVVCATIHSRDDRFAKWTGLARQLFKVAAWCAAKVPHAVMVVSEQLKREVVRDFNVESTVVRNGLTLVPTDGKSETISCWGLIPGQYILTVGRLVHEKATDDLIMAFTKTTLNWKLVIVGEGAHTDDFADHVRELASKDSRIVLTGPAFGASLDALYRSAGAFVLPSRLEGMPVALLEAIAYGLPVIVSDIPANLEVVRTDGPGHRIFPVGDLDALANAMVAVAGDITEETSSAERFRRQIGGDFSWRLAADTTLAVYKSVHP